MGSNINVIRIIDCIYHQLATFYSSIDKSVLDSFSIISKFNGLLIESCNIDYSVYFSPILP
jgi:hypothetical protein